MRNRIAAGCLWMALLACGSTLPAQSQTPLPDAGLLAYYSFDQDDGATVRDDSGGNRTGQVHGATWVAEGARGGAFRFDSNEQCILADDAGLPEGDAPRTMAVWIKLNVLYPEMTTGLLTYGTISYNHLSGVGMDWRNGRDQYYFTQQGGVALSQQKMTRPGEWHHLAYTYGGNGRHHLYVDGVPTDGLNELGGNLETILSGTLIIGGCHPGAAGPNGGFLDEIRIYDRALTREEIAELAAVRNPDKSVAKAPEATPEIPQIAPPAPDKPDAPQIAGTMADAGPNTASIIAPTNAEWELNKIEKGAEQAETMVLQWVSVPGRTYEVQWTDDLTREFTVIASNLVAAGVEMSFTNQMAGARSAFYRVKIQE